PPHTPTPFPYTTLFRSAPSQSSAPSSPSSNGKSEKPVSFPTPAAASSQHPESVSKISSSGKFYSPLVRNIAKQENISMEELESIDRKSTRLNSSHQIIS